MVPKEVTHAPFGALRKEEKVEISGSRVRTAESAAAPGRVMAPEKRDDPTAGYSGAAKPAPLTDAGQWLARIEVLLKDGQGDKALKEWSLFRRAYPDYPVPDTTKEKIEALATRERQ